MAKTKQRDNRNEHKGNANPASRIWLVLPIGLALLLGWILFEPRDAKNTKKEVAAYKVGPADGCRQSPVFPTYHGLQPPFFIDLRQNDYTGMKLIEAKQGGQALVLPGWDDFGHLGPYALTEKGEIFTAPIPFVSLKEKKPEHFSQILKVNNQTGEMSHFLTLPTADNSRSGNPYGIVGMTYDCATASLYVASLSGSTQKQELGTIYQVDSRSGEILSQYGGFDAFGIGVFTTKSGKRLYLGSARSPEVFSIELDKTGDFVGTPRIEFSLAAQQGGSFDNGHRIRFNKDNTMIIKGIEFNYTLMAASDPQRNIYSFIYNQSQDTWDFKEVHRQ